MSKKKRSRSKAAAKRKPPTHKFIVGTEQTPGVYRHGVGFFAPGEYITLPDAATKPGDILSRKFIPTTEGGRQLLERMHPEKPVKDVYDETEELEELDDTGDTDGDENLNVGEVGRTLGEGDANTELSEFEGTGSERAADQ